MTPRSLLTGFIAAALILAGLGLVLAGVFGGGEGPVQVVAPYQSPTPVPPLEAAPTPVSSAAVVRLQVARIGIDAPVVIIGVDPDGTMQSPKTPTDVGWYTFSSRPGQGSNVVMSGHVDYVNYGAAVFYRLRELKAGDRITVGLSDGASYSYEVLSLASYDANAPVADVVGPTPTDSITLITCTGVNGPLADGCVDNVQSDQNFDDSDLSESADIDVIDDLN